MTPAKLKELNELLVEIKDQEQLLVDLNRISVYLAGTPSAIGIFSCNEGSVPLTKIVRMQNIIEAETEKQQETLDTLQAEFDAG